MTTGFAPKHLDGSITATYRCSATVTTAQMQKARELTLLPVLLPLTAGAFLWVDLLVVDIDSCNLRKHAIVRLLSSVRDSYGSGGVNPGAYLAAVDRGRHAALEPDCRLCTSH